MKANRSAESIERRQRLAGYLKALRSLPRETFPRKDVLDRFNVATAAAGDVARFVKITALAVAPGDGIRLRFAVDKPLLLETEKAEAPWTFASKR